VWQGQQLLPSAWVAEASSRQVPNGPSPIPDWEQGYGYQFWRCQHGAYRGDGAFGQFCIVLPDQDAVSAITAGVDNLDMQDVLDLVWKHLLPAFGASPRAVDASGHKDLSDRLSALRVTPTSGQSVSPRATETSGRDFALDDNPQKLTAIRFDFAADRCTLVVRSPDGEQTIPCGYGHWLESEGPAPAIRGRFDQGQARAKVAASGAWTNDQTFMVDICWTETPFRRTLTCSFDGDGLTIDQRMNDSIGATELPRLVGRAPANAAT
jgi:hypothetical protein